MEILSKLLLIILIAVIRKSSSLDCKDVQSNECSCFKYDTLEFQCPKIDSNMYVVISQRNSIEMQCQKASKPYIDIDMLPQVNMTEVSTLKIEFCKLDNNFNKLFDKFYAHNLSALVFDGIIDNEDDDGYFKFSKNLLESLDNLKLLSLSEQKMSLDKDFLANTPNLTALSLNNLHLHDLNVSFKLAPKLKYLDIATNKIDAIPVGLFENLTNLTILHLYRNNIKEISRAAFKGAENIRRLELSSNAIENIAEDSFWDLTRLVNISLRVNFVKKLHSNTFSHNYLLESVRLGRNPNMIIEDRLFENLTTLRAIELSSCNFTTIPENIFNNCPKLTDIYLDQNSLTSLSPKLFHNLKQLKKLVLSKNQIQILSPGIFESLRNLEELNLSYNRINTIDSKLFSELRALKTLHLAKNQIHTIAFNAFAGIDESLVYLDISDNLWNDTYKGGLEAGGSALRNMVNLRTLLLMNNQLQDIPEMYSASYLSKLDMTNNNISILEMYRFMYQTNLETEIVLTGNRIDCVIFGVRALELYKENSKQFSKGLNFRINLSHNPIKCDCSNYELSLYNFDRTQYKTSVALNLSQLYCANDNSTRFVDIQPSELECPVVDGCPSKCTNCMYKPDFEAIFVNCSYGNLTSYPYFKWNRTQSGFDRTHLIMRGNKLTHGPEIDLIDYETVLSMDLSDNSIHELNWIPPKLQELDLSNNNLQNLNKTILNQLMINRTALQRVILKDNPWHCDCDSMDLQIYLQRNYQKVNSNDVYCKNTQTQLIKMIDLCKVSPYLSIVLPIVLSIILCFSIVVAIYYRYQTEIKVYLFAKQMCLWFVTEEELDQDKIYDVFVSYSHQDEEFVLKHLMPELERKEQPYKVCIHVRDWQPGEFIQKQVVQSVAHSRRTLVVLSNNFMDSEWGKVEFRTAHTEAIREGRVRVIVVVYGDLDESKLDDELKAYIKTNTYVKWGEKYFWNKLKYALPHPSSNFAGVNKKHAKLMLKIDDEFDLVKTPPSPSNTSTPPVILNPATLEQNLGKEIEGVNPLLKSVVIQT